MAKKDAFEHSLHEVKAGKATEPLWLTVKRIYALLNKQERQVILPMAFVIMVSSIVELAGIAVVIPVIGVAVKPDMVAKSPRLGAIFEWSGMESGADFATTATILMCLVITFKVTLSLFVQWWQTRFAFQIAHRLSGVMWDLNFAQSIEDVVNRSNGKMLSEISAWPTQFAKRGLFSVITLASELMVLSGIGLALILYKPLVMLATGSIIGVGSLLLRIFVKTRIAEYITIEKEAGPKAMSVLTNAVQGMREIVTFNAVDIMKDEYLETNHQNFIISSNLFLLNQIPRPLYEWLAVLSIGGAILISFQLDIRNEDFLSMLTFLAIGAYRMMPAVSKISQRSQDLRSSAFVIETLEKGVAYQAMVSAEKDQTHASSLPRPTDRVSIEIEDLTFRYKNVRKPIFRDLSHTFEAGTLTAIIGPSGAGKSSLINCLMGLNPIESGTIRMRVGDKSWTLGENIRRQDWLNQTSYLAQQPFLFPGTVRDNLTMKIPGFDLDEDLTLELIERLGLQEVLQTKRELELERGRERELGRERGQERGEEREAVSPLKFRLSDGGNNLSGGQKQRVGLLRSLQVKKPIMILDEATSDLDHKSRNMVFDILRERAAEGCTILLVTHDRQIADQCDANFVLPHGKSVKMTSYL